VREIDQLASIFDRIVHVAMLHIGPAPDAAREYASPVQFVPVRPAAGDGFFGKVHALLRSRHFARVINDNLDAADVVHVRCPANISLVALAVLALHKTPTRRWIKYAGNWQPSGNEALSYRMQRFLLERAPKSIERSSRSTANGLASQLTCAPSSTRRSPLASSSGPFASRTTSR
jgi:hypothetical protein